MTLLLMVNMLASSVMTTEVNAVEAPANASSETITKIAQDAISGSTPTKQSNSVIQKKAASDAETQTITPATSGEKATLLEAPQTKKLANPKSSNLINEQAPVWAQSPGISMIQRRPYIYQAVYCRIKWLMILLIHLGISLTRLILRESRISALMVKLQLKMSPICFGG